MKPKVLILGVHNDDMEYGCGGTAKLLADAGCEVTLGWLTSRYHQSLDGSEQKSDSLTLLGLKEKLCEYVPARDAIRFDEESVAAYTKMIARVQPDIAFIMWPRDNHTEHVHCAKAQLEALTRAGSCCREVYAYEVGPLQSGCFFGMPDITVDISSVMDTVGEVLAHFSGSPVGDEALWYEKEVASALRGHAAYAKVNGFSENFPYAEAFKIVKLPNGSDDFLLRTLLADKFRWGGTGVYYRYKEYYF